MVETELDIGLSVRYGVNRVNPVLEIDDMLPDVSDENKTPGLTLFRFTLSPCLSIVIWRCNVVFCADDSDAVWAGAVLVHSPELPQFSPVQLEAVPWTGLERNKMHSAFASCTAVRITRPMRSGHGVHSPSAVSALSDLSHYQPV